jgi:hypothetical protein
MPSPSTTARSSPGTTGASTGNALAPDRSTPLLEIATTTTVTMTAAGTANRGASFTRTSQVSTIGRASNGSCTLAVTGARQIGKRMPASIALAIGFGMRVTVRASHGQSPVTTSSTPHSRKAPTALGKSSVPVEARSSAAAGVDHTTEIGMRETVLSTTVMSPGTTHSTNSPDAAWSSLAPTLCSPAIKRANDDANPVIPATSPAKIGWASDAGRILPA